MMTPAIPPAKTMARRFLAKLVWDPVMSGLVDMP
jgi:hypothetical protein